MNEVEFFHYLLAETEKAYQASEIKKEKLYYSICATKLKLNHPIIIGFNWGAKQNESYSRQKEYPENENFGQIKDKGSLARTVSFFSEYYKQGINSIQTNYCFFRSKSENDISSKDLKLSSPLFEELIQFLNPSKIICFSSKLRDYFLNSKKLINVEEKKIEIKDYNRSLWIVIGDYQVDDSNVKFVYLPHPNYPIKNELRHIAWKYAFKAGHNII